MRFGCNPFADRGGGWAVEVHLVDDVRASDGRVPDSLDATVDQHHRKGPPLLVEDLAFVGWSEQGFAASRWCPDRIGIE